MKKYLLPLWCLILAGCVVTTRPSAHQLTNVSDISMGSSKQEVERVMGAEVVVGYERSDNTGGTFVPITVKNPTRIEYVEGAGKKYEVEYYFTQIKQADGNITDDELTPMVFDHDRLVGKNWEFLNDIKKYSR